MKLEDLFVSQRPPKDYVTYPPQEIPTLEKFLAERTLPKQSSPSVIVKPKQGLDTTKLDPSSPVYTGPKVSEEIPEQEVEQIKQIYSLQEPQPQMTQPQMPQPEAQIPSGMETEQVMQTMGRVPARSPIDLQEISDQADKMARKTSWQDLLPALAPLAVEALFGPSIKGESYTLAGDYLVGEAQKEQARKQKLEDALLALEKSRLSKKPLQSKMQLKPLRDRITGETAIGSYDPSTDTMYVQGKPVDTRQFELAPGLSTQEFGRRQDILQQKQKAMGEYFGKGKFLNPETGLYSTVKNGVVVPLQVQENQLNPKQQKDLNEIVKSFRATDAYKKPLAALQDAASVDELLNQANSGNAVSANAARTKLARMSGEVGALSDRDLAAYGGSPAYRARAKRFANLQRTMVPLTPEDIAQLKEIAKIFENSARFNMNNSIAGLEQDFVQMGGPLGAVQTKMNAYVPKPKSEVSSVQDDMVKVISPQGKPGSIPKKNLKKALDKGYRLQ